MGKVSKMHIPHPFLRKHLKMCPLKLEHKPKTGRMEYRKRRSNARGRWREFLCWCWREVLGQQLCNKQGGQPYISSSEATEKVLQEDKLIEIWCGWKEMVDNLWRVWGWIGDKYMQYLIYTNKRQLTPGKTKDCSKKGKTIKVYYKAQAWIGYMVIIL